MKVEELKNYGKGFADFWTDPELMGQMRGAMSRELRRQLGLIGMLRLWWRMRKETNRMRKHDWSRLRERGLTDRNSLDQLIQSMAVMKALADMMGMEKASEVHRKLWDNTAYELMASVFPSVGDVQACGDFLECFKEYMNAMNAANVRAGLHEVEIGEDTDDVFQVNYKYCAWHEVAKEFGDANLCYPSSCYPDEAWLPRYCAQAGIQFKRTGTLATGAPVCDFRFERVAGGGN